MPANLYAFYGSLRRGLHNHEVFKPHLNYQFSIWLQGFQLYSFGDFPFAIRTEKKVDKILVEVFEIEKKEIEKQIAELELGYGYHSESVFIDHVPVKIYLLKESANYPLVSGGDWVKFFRG